MNHTIAYTNIKHCRISLTTLAGLIYILPPLLFLFAGCAQESKDTSLSLNHWETELAQNDNRSIIPSDIKIKTAGPAAPDLFSQLNSTTAEASGTESAQTPQTSPSEKFDLPILPAQVPLAADTAEPNESRSAEIVTPSNLPRFADPNTANELISVNFDQMDIRTVIKTIGDITGINFVVDDGVQGTVTVMSPTKIRLGDIFEFLQSILEVKGFAAVPSENLVKIVPRAEAAKRNLTVRIGSDPDHIPESDSIVTQMIPLKSADAVEVSQIIRPLLSTGSQLSTYPRTNTIVITDTSSNIFHAARVIQQLDRMGSEEKVSLIYLTHASADIVSEQIIQIMEKGKSASSQPGRSTQAASVEGQLKIFTDARTNSLIAVANLQDTERIKSLAKQLDVKRPRGTNNVHVVYLKNAPAKETAQSMATALANLKISGAINNPSQQISVSADEGTNALIINASAQDFEVINDIIEKLDIVRESVLVEMLIVEISQDSLNEIGVDWATLDQAVEGDVRYFGGTNFGIRDGFTAGDLEGLTVGAWKKTGSTTSVGSIMTALEKISGVNILSTPHILTLNHQKAKIIVGENMPFVTQSRITDTEPQTPTVIKTFEYKDVGITLEITPHISQAGLVRLELNSEFTKLVETVSATSNSTALETPTTAKRQAQTVVSMNNGSTVVIGGLIRDDKVTLRKKIPFVGDLPLVGPLFRFQRDRLQKTNMLIFITPHIVSSQKDLDTLTVRKKQQMSSAAEDINNKKDKTGVK